MGKLWRRFLFCFVIALIFWGWTLISDAVALRSNIIRFHVVADSDENKAQSQKLLVRDAIVSAIQGDLQSITDISAAREYLKENLPRIKKIAEKTLERTGFDGEVMVTLCKEAFDTRVYDTFTLPAGVYEALRITIGSGEGRNWWCVVFPSLCIPATISEFEVTAEAGGFPNRLTSTLTRQDGYNVRFFLMDKLGEFENTLFAK